MKDAKRQKHLGRALFAKRALPQGTLVAKCSGDVVHVTEAIKRRHASHMLRLQGTDFVVDGRPSLIHWFVHHTHLDNGNPLRTRLPLLALRVWRIQCHAPLLQPRCVSSATTPAQEFGLEVTFRKLRQAN